MKKENQQIAAIEIAENNQNVEKNNFQQNEETALIKVGLKSASSNESGYTQTATANSESGKTDFSATLNGETATAHTESGKTDFSATLKDKTATANGESGKTFTHDERGKDKTTTAHTESIKCETLATLSESSGAEKITKTKKKNDGKEKMTLTKRLTGTAAFAALAFAVSYLEFPIFPQAPFLKLDFSLMIITLAAFIYGFVPAMAASLVKELLCFLLKSSSGGVGELCNFALTLGFILVPCVCYRYKKGLPYVVLYFAVSCIIQTALGLLMNYYINFPLYMGDKAAEYFKALWQFILYFNLIKTVSVSILTILFYKRLKNVIMKI